MCRARDLSAVVTAHDGGASVRGVLESFVRAGMEVRNAEGDCFPEGADEVERRALCALARMRSPRGALLLLAQRARWAAWDGVHPRGEEILARSARLDALLHPALIAAVGSTNVGKSTLLNELAGRSVSIVADEAGVTRDHVGAMLTLDGVAVRWVDTPGVMEAADRIDEAAWSRASDVITLADVVVVCGDSTTGFESLKRLPAVRGRVIRVGTRCDLGPVVGADVSTSVLRGEGLESLAREVRRAVVADADLEWAGPWAFDEGLVRRVRESGGG